MALRTIFASFRLHSPDAGRREGNNGSTRSGMNKQKKTSWTDGWERFRRWLDGEDPSVSSEESDRPGNEGNLFFVRLAREIEKVMRQEMFTPPGGQTYLPPEYLIYLSREDDQLWQGRKREALEEALQEGLARRARELVGDRPLRTTRLVLSFGVDGTLNRGEVRVQPVWEELSQTEVLPRRPGASPPPASAEATLVMARPRRFAVRFGRSGSGQTECPEGIFAAQGESVTLGRGGQGQTVDLVLTGDLEISRRHVTITQVARGLYQIACLGRNPIEVGEEEVLPGEEAVVRPGQSIRIGSYQLWIEEPSSQE